MLAVALIYAGNYSIAKLVLDDHYILPKGFIVIRACSGLLLFALFHLLFIREKVERKDLLTLAACGLFGVAINQMFFFMGLKLTNPINASLIMLTSPMVVIILSALILKSKIHYQTILGIIIGALGAVMLITNGKFQFETNDQLWGDIMIFINASSYAVYLVIVKKLMKKYNPLTIVKWVFLFGFLFVLPFGYGDLQQIDTATFSPTIWYSIAYVLLGTTFLTYFLNAQALNIVNPSTVSIYIYLQPLFATIIAILMGSAELNSTKISAGIIIISGLILASIKKS